MTDRLPDQMLSPRDLASFLGVTFRTVQRWIYARKIKPSFTTMGGHHRFSPLDADNIRRKMCYQRQRPVPKPAETDIFD